MRKMDRGHSQALAASEDRISRQSKETSLYPKRGLKSSSKMRLHHELKPSQDSSAIKNGTEVPADSNAARSGLPAIVQPAHGRRNGTKGDSMMSNKSKKESQTAWGAEWPVPALIEAKAGEAGTKRNLRRQEMPDQVKNLPLSSFSFRTTDFKTADRQEAQKPAQPLPKPVPESKASQHAAQASEAAQAAQSIQLKLKSMGPKSSVLVPANANDPMRKTTLARKRGTQDQKLFHASFFFLQDQEFGKKRVKRKDRPVPENTMAN